MNFWQAIVCMCIAVCSGQSLVSYPGSHRRLLIDSSNGQRVVDVIGHVSIPLLEGEDSYLATEEKLCQVIQTLDLDAVISRRLSWFLPLISSEQVATFLSRQGIAFEKTNFEHIFFDLIQGHSSFIISLCDRLHHKVVYKKEYLLGGEISDKSVGDCISTLTRIKQVVDYFKEELDAKNNEKCSSLATYISDQLTSIIDGFTNPKQPLNTFLTNIAELDARRLYTELSSWACIAPVVLQALTVVACSDDTQVILSMPVECAIITAAGIREFCSGKEHIVMETSWPVSMRPRWTPVPLFENDWVYLSQNPAMQEEQIMQPSELFEKHYDAALYLGEH